MLLSAMTVYPLKSGAGVDVDHACVLPWGLEGDRRWMVVDRDGALLSARTEHRLLQIRARTTGREGELALAAPGLDPILVPRPQGGTVPVRLHGHDLRGIPGDPAANAWVGKVLGRDDARLVWCDDPTRRRPNPDFSRAGDSVSYADGYPLQLTSTRSLDQLGEWIAQGAAERGEPAPEAVPMTRFRPSVVVDGAQEPFEEDRWKRVRIGEVELRVAKACDRCVMTLVDPRTLATGKEPIRTLARHRRFEGKTLFGALLIPDVLGTLRVGDQVTVLER